MREIPSFGAWLKRRRKALDLTQEALARLVGCAVVSIRKIEADEQRPSRQTAERLAQHVQIAPEEQATFVQFARLGLDEIPPPLPIPAPAQLPARPPQHQLDFIVTPAPQTTLLPHPSTPFIGRAAELAELSGLLDDPACRLLTLSGPGGIGKTRLALALAQECADHYPHGVWFVNLAPLSSAEGVVLAIADTFKLSALRVVDLKEALRNYLHEKALLLVLDNFEHVLEAADLVAELLDAAGVQVLATSRERLHLRAERVYELGGLPFPVDATRADADTFDAVRMFVACVRHAHPQHTLDATETPAVAQICRLAAGMPLGIELAAAWVPTLSAATIAAELAASLNLLETTMRDVPERHRSARAAFAHSWNLLSAEEQAVFQQLSVFRGGFTREAAVQVAGTTLGTLARLVDTSLVRAARHGRYDMHELLRQFAAENLAADPGAEECTRERHSAFFLELLQRNEPALKGRQQLTGLEEIEREFENARLAWDWALQCGQWERLRQSSVAFTFFMAIRGLPQEAIALLQQIVDTIAAAERSVADMAQRQGLVAYVLTSQSWFFSRLGQVDKQVSGLERSRAAVHEYGTPYEIAIHCHFYASTRADPEEARDLNEQALAILREIGATWDVAYVIRNMGEVAMALGQMFVAKRHYEEALALFRSIGEVQGASVALLNLGRVACALGNYGEARQLLGESLAFSQAVGSKIRAAECQELLGEIAYAQGQFAEAEAHFRQQLAIIPDLGYRELLSVSFSHVGAAVLAQDRLGEAATLLAEALAIAQECADPRGIALAHTRLGELVLRQGTPDAARRHWRTALDVAWRVQNRPHVLVTLDALIGLATLMAQAGDAEPAVEVLALVRDVARIDRRTENKAEQVLAELEARLSAVCFAAAQARGRALELGATVAAMLAEAVV